MNYFEIEIDGVDRTGKDTLLKTLEYLGNYKYSINVRGLISQLVYSKKYKRNYNYNLKNASKSKLYVLLWAEDEDISARCHVSGEKIVSYAQDQVEFMDTFDRLKLEGFDCISFNTSRQTPYYIAKKIIEHLEEKEKLDEI